MNPKPMSLCPVLCLGCMLVMGCQREYSPAGNWAFDWGPHPLIQSTPPTKDAPVLSIYTDGSLDFFGDSGTLTPSRRKAEFLISIYRPSQMVRFLSSHPNRFTLTLTSNSTGFILLDSRYGRTTTVNLKRL